MSDKITDEMVETADQAAAKVYWEAKSDETVFDVRLKMHRAALAAVYPLIEKQVREECAQAVDDCANATCKTASPTWPYTAYPAQLLKSET